MGHVFQHVAENKRHFFALYNCFEFFGFDFLVDQDGVNTWLLEVNPEPSMKIYERSTRAAVMRIKGQPGGCPFLGIPHPERELFEMVAPNLSVSKEEWNAPLRSCKNQETQNE